MKIKKVIETALKSPSNAYHLQTLMQLRCLNWVVSILS